MRTLSIEVSINLIDNLLVNHNSMIRELEGGDNDGVIGLDYIYGSLKD